MAVARVTSIESIRTGTQDPYTFSHNGGTPEGIAIAVVNGANAVIVSAIDYGGVALQNIVSAQDTATETGRATWWFVGSGIPAGTQTVTVDLTGAVSDDVHFVLVELSGAADLEVIDFDLLEENQGNPTVTLQKNGRTAICLAAMYGGGAAPGGTLAAGNTLDHTHDLGNFYSQTCFETTVDNADHTIGWSSLASDDLAFVAIAISEVLPAVDFDQAGFRFRNDDGNETGATWIAAENTDILTSNESLPFRIRFVVDETTAAGSVDQNFQLQYRKNGGSWLNVTTTSANVRTRLSANFADEDATTRQLTSGSGTFTPGVLDEDGVPGFGGGIDFGAGNLTEIECSCVLQAADLVEGDVIELRLVANPGNTAFDLYSQIPSITIPTTPRYYGGLGDTGFPYFAGPHRSDAGDYYMVMREGLDGAGDEDLSIWKSTDDAATWTKVATIQGAASTTDVRNVATCRDGSNILHTVFVTHDAANDEKFYYHAWEMDADTEEVALELAVSGTEIHGANSQTAIVVRSNGVVVIGYSFQQVGTLETYVARRVSGTWQTPQLLDTTFTQPHAISLVLADNNDVHAFWHGWSSGGSGIKHAVLRASDDSISTIDVITTTGTSQQNNGRAGRAGNRLFVCQVNASGNIIAWHSDAISEAPTWASTDFAQGALDVPASMRPYDLHFSGNRVVIGWILESDQSFNYRQWDEDSDAWASTVTPGDTQTPEEAHMHLSCTNDGVNVTMFLVTESVTTPDNSNALIRSFNLGAVIVPPSFRYQHPHRMQLVRYRP